MYKDNQNFNSPSNTKANDKHNISNYNMNNDGSNYNTNLSLGDQRNSNPLNKSKHIDAMESRAANMEALAKARYFALSQKRTLPPRISPIGILLLIMMAGIIFVGITITIVAYWPGLATIGEDRMKVAGPIVLTFGLLGIILVCIATTTWTIKQNKRWRDELTERARKHISQSQEPIIDSSYQSSIHDVPGRQHKTDTEGRLKFGMGAGEGRTVVGGLPLAKNNDYNEEDSIPDPQRKQKQHRMLKQDSDWSQGSTNQSFSAGEADMHIPGISYTHSPTQSDIKIVTKTTKTTKTTTKKTKKGSHEQGRYGNQKEDPIRDVLDNSGKKLKVSIKAKSKTAVKISPSPTPPRVQQGYSMESEI